MRCCIEMMMTTTTNTNESNDDNSNSTSDLQELMGSYRLSWTVVIGVIIIVFILIGNTLVILAVVIFRRLRSVANYFIASLAVADLTVAIFVMPLSVYYEMYGEWGLGWSLCHFWISCDVMCCTASILHLCAISIDRYVAITQPLKYRKRMPKRRAFAIIAAIWFCSGAISFVPIFLGWYRASFTEIVPLDEERYSMVNSSSDAILNFSFSSSSSSLDFFYDESICGLRPNPTYAIISSSTSFYFPLVVMIVVYAKIFRIAKRQAQEIEFLEKSFRQQQQQQQHQNNPSKVGARLNYKRSLRIRRDSKAIKTLGTLMGLFCVGWMPFFLVYLITPICGRRCYSWIGRELEVAVTWLGYCNSFINPCVYAFMNKDFRTSFKKILICDCRKKFAWYRESTTTTATATAGHASSSSDTLASSCSRRALLQQITTAVRPKTETFIYAQRNGSATDIRLKIMKFPYNGPVIGDGPDRKTTAFDETT